MPAPKLVIFDCDGVLVDSERISNRVMAAFLNRHGAELTPQSCHDRFVGTSRSAVETYMIENGTPLRAEWSTEYYPEMLAVLEREVTAIDGAPQMLEALSDAGMDRCVASNGMVIKMHVTLGKTGMRHHFGEALYSAYDVGLSKPAPDVFLHAAKTHGVAPQDCVVIEDSASGIEAAFNAGMRCFAYAPIGPLPAPLLRHAQPFKHMSEVPVLLGI